MTDKASEPDEKEAERRFNETLGRLVNTPHKPHAPLNRAVTESPETGKKRVAPKSDPSS